MDHNFWLQAWIDGKTAFHQTEYNPFLVKFTKELNLNNKSVFLPLAGKTKDILYLLEKGAFVIANELSTKAVEDFFNENNLEYTLEDKKIFKIYKSGTLTFINGDFFALTKNEVPNIDFLYDRASLVALPPEMRKDYYKKLHTLTNKETKMILLTLTHDGPKEFGPPFYVPIEEVKKNYLKEHTIEHTPLKEMEMSEESRFGEAGITKMRRILWTHNI